MTKITALSQGMRAMTTTLRCKQRLNTIPDTFSLDLAFCLRKEADQWSVLAVRGPLANRNCGELLPLHNLEVTASGGKGTRTLECVGPEAKLVSTVSQISGDGRTVFVVMKLVENGVYGKEALWALRRHLEVFAQAGV